MIIDNNTTLKIFLATFLTMLINIVFPTILFLKLKLKHKNKNLEIKKIFFYVVIPELLIFVFSISLLSAYVFSIISSFHQ